LQSTLADSTRPGLPLAANTDATANFIFSDNDTMDTTDSIAENANPFAFTTAS
jgi:hypothetical protein